MRFHTTSVAGGSAALMRSRTAGDPPAGTARWYWWLPELWFL